jgi:dihydrofolate synthase/folylpolyglutamate synthase
MNITKTTEKKKKLAIVGKQRSYTEVIAYLDSNWAVSAPNKTIERMKKLDTAFETVSKQLDTLLVAGTNGKSLTVHYTNKILQSEGLSVGTFYSPHVLTYNERIAVNQIAIPSKAFADLANEVINTAETMQVKATSYEILTMMALLYFKEQNVDVAILEVNEGGLNNAVNICDAKVATITRVTAPNTLTNETEVIELAKVMTGIVKNGTWVIAGDQSKAHLQLIQQIAEENGGQWAMPIRKLAPLPYPFEQLHGRCAALAERVAKIYVNECAVQNTTIVSDSLLVKQEGRRGRPTIAVKQQLLLNPKRTPEQFWKETANTLPGIFQLLDKEKPTVLLDNASNIDAFKNLLLGVRLLQYQRPLKGLTLIIGAAQSALHDEEFLKLIRYFFKKTSGQIFICPIDAALPGNNEEKSWDVEQVVNDIKSMKMRAQGFSSFQKAFDAARTSVDERHGLVVVTGSKSIVNNYWDHIKGIKKIG